MSGDIESGTESGSRGGGSSNMGWAHVNGSRSPSTTGGSVGNRAVHRRSRVRRHCDDRSAAHSRPDFFAARLIVLREPPAPFARPRDNVCDLLFLVSAATAAAATTTITTTTTTTTTTAPPPPPPGRSFSNPRPFLPALRFLVSLIFQKIRRKNLSFFIFFFSFLQSRDKPTRGGEHQARPFTPPVPPPYTHSCTIAATTTTVSTTTTTTVATTIVTVTDMLLDPVETEATVPRSCPLCFFSRGRRKVEPSWNCGGRPKRKQLQRGPGGLFSSFRLDEQPIRLARFVNDSGPVVRG